MKTSLSHYYFTVKAIMHKCCIFLHYYHIWRTCFGYLALFFAYLYRFYAAKSELFICPYFSSQKLTQIKNNTAKLPWAIVFYLGKSALVSYLNERICFTFLFCDVILLLVGKQIIKPMRRKNFMDLIAKFKSALPITYTEEYKVKETQKSIVQIPIHTIVANPYQPRRSFDADSISELADSIRKYGVIQPITVRKLRGDQYELIAGERRLRACTMAGMLKIPAIVVSLSDNDSAVVALVENIQRENLSFMEEAEAYRNLLCNHGFTQEELAKHLGKTQSSVANKVRLLKLPAVVREIIKDNALTERHARALLRLDSEDKQIKALERITDENLNVQQTDELVDEMINAKIKKKSDIKSFADKRCLKDVRIFVNTVRHAIDVMKKNGIEADAEENEFEEYYEYIIHIPKA